MFPGPGETVLKLNPLPIIERALGLARQLHPDLFRELVIPVINDEVAILHDGPGIDALKLLIESLEGLFIVGHALVRVVVLVCSHDRTEQIVLSLQPTVIGILTRFSRCSLSLLSFLRTWNRGGCAGGFLIRNGLLYGGSGCSCCGCAFGC